MTHRRQLYALRCSSGHKKAAAAGQQGLSYRGSSTSAVHVPRDGPQYHCGNDDANADANVGASNVRTRVMGLRMLEVKWPEGPLLRLSFDILQIRGVVDQQSCCTLRRTHSNRKMPEPAK